MERRRVPIGWVALGVVVVLVIGLAVILTRGGNTKTTTKASNPVAANSAQAALGRLFDQLTKAQFAAAWDDLHPAQQAFIPRDLYVRCTQQRSGDTHIVGARQAGVYSVRTGVPGTTLRAQPSTAITARVTYRQGTQPPQTRTATFYEFLVSGRWRWIATGDVDAYKRGACPQR